MAGELIQIRPLSIEKGIAQPGNLWRHTTASKPRGFQSSTQDAARQQHVRIKRYVQIKQLRTSFNKTMGGEGRGGSTGPTHSKGYLTKVSMTTLSIESLSGMTPVHVTSIQKPFGDS